MSIDPDLQPVRRQRPPGTVRIGQVGGTDVLVTTSWFLIAALLTVLFAPSIDRAQPGLGAWTYVAGLALVVLLYLSVLLHEVAHALAARHFHHPVGSITLHFLGGVTEIEGESRRPREEFWIAVVGPLTSLALALVARGLWLAVPDATLLKLVTDFLFLSNLVVGLLNLVPGLPLDGGRVLKAGVWAIGGNPHRGTVVAAWGGRVAAVAVLGWPLLREALGGYPPGLLDFALAAMVALFLWSGASASLSSARVRRKLPSLVARGIARRTLAVPGELPLAEAVRRAQDAQAGSIVTLAGDQPVGIVTESALLATPEDRRPWVATSTVARSLSPGLTLPASIAGEDLVLAVSRAPASEYLLLEDDGSIFGVLSTADLDAAFRQAHA